MDTSLFEDYLLSRPLMMDSLGSPKRWVHKTLQQVIPPLSKMIIVAPKRKLTLRKLLDP